MYSIINAKVDSRAQGAMFLHHLSFPPRKPINWNAVQDAVLPMVNAMGRNGISVWNSRLNAPSLVRIVLLSAATDGQFRPLEACKMGPGACQGCMECDFAAKSVHTANGGTFRCWQDDASLLLQTDHPERTGEPPQLKSHAYCVNRQAALEDARADLRAGNTTKAAIHALEQQHGILGASSFGRNLDYADDIGTECSNSFPPDDMHLTKNMICSLFGVPAKHPGKGGVPKTATLHNYSNFIDVAVDPVVSNVGFIQLRYPGALLPISERMVGIELPTRHGEKVVLILRNLIQNPYANSHDWHMFVKSGLIEYALFGNIPVSDYVILRDWLWAVRRNITGVTEPSFLEQLHNDTVLAKHRLNGLIPASCNTVQFHTFLHKPTRMRTTGPDANNACWTGESKLGRMARSNHSKKTPCESIALQFVMEHYVGSAWYVEDSIQKGDAALKWTYPKSPAPNNMTLTAAQADLLRVAAESVGSYTPMEPTVVRNFRGASWKRIEFSTYNERNNGVAFVWTLSTGEQVLRYGIVTEIVDVPHAGGLACFFISMFVTPGDDPAPLWYDQLEAPCFPTSNGRKSGVLVQRVCVPISSVAGQVSWHALLDSDGGTVLVVSALSMEPTHHAHYLKLQFMKAGVAIIPRPLLRLLFGHLRHSEVETLRKVRWRKPWPNALPPLSSAVPCAGGVDAAVDAEVELELSDGEEGGACADALQTQEEIEDGEFLESATARVKRLRREKLEMHGPTPQMRGRQMAASQRNYSVHAVNPGGCAVCGGQLPHGLSVQCRFQACSAACCRIRRANTAGGSSAPLICILRMHQDE